MSRSPTPRSTRAAKVVPSPVLSAASSALNRNQTLTQVLRHTVIAARLTRAALAQPGHDGRELCLSHLAHASDTPPLPGIALPLAKLSWLRRELSDGLAHAWEVTGLPKGASAERMLWQGYGIAAVAFEPIPADTGAAPSWLMAEASDPDWSESRLAVLRLAAAALGETLHSDGVREVLRDTRSELQHLRQQLNDLDPTDPLTGVLNRDHLVMALSQEFSRAIREQTPVSLILADIDDFTDYNERNGREAGDYCLQQVAAILAGAFERAGERVARWSHDSFAVLMPGLEPDKARSAACRLLAAVRARRLPHGGDKPFLSLSLGLATLLPGPSLGSAQLIELAGRALLEARASGDKLICQSLV